MKHLKIILTTVTCLAILACSPSTTPRKPATKGSTPEEVDSLVQELWLDLNGSKLTPLKDWIAQPNHQVDFLTREEAAKVAETSLKVHQVELLTVTDARLPNWTQFLVCDATKVADKAAYKNFLMSASAGKKLEVQYGNRWVVFAEADEPEDNP